MSSCTLTMAEIDDGELRPQVLLTLDHGGTRRMDSDALHLRGGDKLVIRQAVGGG